uniref:Variant erythrocyte surface antigen-1, alpha subunit n=1 Tax=Strongyloides venezuelensis TaxID=75913 RepID=A0A0K0FIG3_STRVS
MAISPILGTLIGGSSSKTSSTVSHSTGLFLLLLTLLVLIVGRLSKKESSIPSQSTDPILVTPKWGTLVHIWVLRYKKKPFRSKVFILRKYADSLSGEGYNMGQRYIGLFGLKCSQGLACALGDSLVLYNDNPGPAYIIWRTWALALSTQPRFSNLFQSLISPTALGSKENTAKAQPVFSTLLKQISVCRLPLVIPSSVNLINALFNFVAMFLTMLLIYIHKVDFTKSKIWKLL